MSLMNRLGNCKNPYQTQAKRVLCVCSAGLLRSPTAANVLHKKYGFNTRAAGCVEEYALVPVDRALLEWADEVVFMEHGHMQIVCQNFEDWFSSSMVVLDVPDEFEWNHPELCKLILDRYEDSLNYGSDDTSSSS
jgi:predicted protein tyrosine phosphatase